MGSPALLKLGGGGWRREEPVQLSPLGLLIFPGWSSRAWRATAREVGFPASSGGGWTNNDGWAVRATLLLLISTCEFRASSFPPDSLSVKET